MGSYEAIRAHPGPRIHSQQAASGRLAQDTKGAQAQEATAPQEALPMFQPNRWYTMLSMPGKSLLDKTITQVFPDNEDLEPITYTYDVNHKNFFVQCKCCSEWVCDAFKTEMKFSELVGAVDQHVKKQEHQESYTLWTAARRSVGGGRPD